jgi:hypothetical protein
MDHLGAALGRSSPPACSRRARRSAPPSGSPRGSGSRRRCCSPSGSGTRRRGRRPLAPRGPAPVVAVPLPPALRGFLALAALFAMASRSRGRGGRWRRCSASGLRGPVRRGGAPARDLRGEISRARRRTVKAPGPRGSPCGDLTPAGAGNTSPAHALDGRPGPIGRRREPWQT